MTLFGRTNDTRLAHAKFAHKQDIFARRDCCKEFGLSVNLQQPLVVTVSQDKILEFRDLLLLEREC